MNNCINIIKTSINNKKKGFIIIKNKKNLELIRQFLKIGVISYVITKNKYLIGFINYKNNKPVFRNIVNIFKPSRKKYISLNNLKKTLSKHNWILILSTNKGILNSLDAVNLNVGGLIIAQIWN